MKNVEFLIESIREKALDSSPFSISTALHHVTSPLETPEGRYADAEALVVLSGLLLVALVTPEAEEASPRSAPKKQFNPSSKGISDESSPYVTAVQAARLIGCSPSLIYHMIKDGTLATVSVEQVRPGRKGGVLPTNQKYFFTKESIEQYLNPINEEVG